jgi:hypothetical protein
MCTLSFVGDSARDRWQPAVYPQYPPPGTNGQQLVIRQDVDVEALRREVAEVKELLIAAKEIDKRLGLADCEMEEKVEFLKAFAKLLDVDLSEVFE